MEQGSANSGLAKGGLKCLIETFVLKETFVLRMKFIVENGGIGEADNG